MGSDFVINPDFHAVHIQSPIMDVLFVALFVLCIFFVFQIFPYLPSIIKYCTKLDSNITISRLNIKHGHVLLAKVMILISLPISFSMIESFYPVSTLFGLALPSIALFFVMLFRYSVTRFISAVSNCGEELDIIWGTSDFYVLFFSLVYSVVVILSYSFGAFPLLPFVIIGGYLISHVMRMIMVLKNVVFSFFDIILYLCVLEILPLVIVMLSVLKVVG